MQKHVFKSKGGSWLGAVRSWIQWNCVNGDSVTWDSNDELRSPVTVKRLEDAAGDAAWATIEPFYNIEKGLREMFAMQLNEGKSAKKVIEEMKEGFKKLEKQLSNFVN